MRRLTSNNWREALKHFYGSLPSRPVDRATEIKTAFLRWGKRHKLADELTKFVYIHDIRGVTGENDLREWLHDARIGGFGDVLNEYARRISSISVEDFQLSRDEIIQDAYDFIREVYIALPGPCSPKSHEPKIEFEELCDLLFSSLVSEGSCSKDFADDVSDGEILESIKIFFYFHFVESIAVPELESVFANGPLSGCLGVALRYAGLVFLQIVDYSLRERILDFVENARREYEIGDCSSSHDAESPPEQLQNWNLSNDSTGDLEDAVGDNEQDSIEGQDTESDQE